MFLRLKYENPKLHIIYMTTTTFQEHSNNLTYVALFTNMDAVEVVDCMIVSKYIFFFCNMCYYFKNHC